VKKIMKKNKLRTIVIHLSMGSKIYKV